MHLRVCLNHQTTKGDDMDSETKDQIKLAYLETEKVEAAFALVRERYGSRYFYTSYGHARKSDPIFRRDMKEIKDLIKIRREVRKTIAKALREIKRREFTPEKRRQHAQRMIDEFEKSLTNTIKKVGINNSMYHSFRDEFPGFAKKIDKLISEAHESRSIGKRRRELRDYGTPPPPLWQPPRI